MHYLLRSRRKTGEKIKRTRRGPEQPGVRTSRIGPLVTADPPFHARHFHHRGSKHHQAATRSHSIHAKLGSERHYWIFNNSFWSKSKMIFSMYLQQPVPVHSQQHQAEDFNW